MKSSRLIAAVLAVSSMLAVSACGTAVGPDSPASAASAASGVSVSHYRAELTTGYTLIEAVRIAATAALNAKDLSVEKAEAVQVQCKAFTKTLDTLAAAGESPSNSEMLSATMLAVKALTVYVTVTQGVPK